MSDEGLSRTPGRRSACDRCRTQKLRCLRVDGHSTDACTRCVRSQVECITSSSKRPGRPTRHSTEASRQNIDPAPTTCNDAHQPIHAFEIPQENVEDWFSLGSLDANFEMASACWTSGETGDSYTHDFSMGIGDNAFTLPSLSTTANGTSNPTPINELTEPTLSEHSPTVQSEQGNNGMLQLFTHQLSAPNGDHGLRLSVLYCDLSKQLCTIRSMPWDMTEVMQLTCIHSTGIDPANVFQTNIASNPLASVARRSAEFAELLWSFQNPMASDGNNATAASGPLSSAHPHLSMADLLTTLSCHILIISIYESIFCHFVDQSLHNPGAVNVVMQAAPKLFLGGIAVPPWPNMLGHLLFCLTESQLRPIELLLGLPDEFCVSLKRNSVSKDRHHGLFSGQSGQSLFTALMQVEIERSTEERGGLGVIESLKEKTRRVQGLK